MNLTKLKHVYVSSARRGFLAVVDRPFCVDSPFGMSSDNLLLSVKRVVWRDGTWQEAEPAATAQLWLRRAWEDAVALCGDEPWRIYELDSEAVAAQLEEGRHTDDIRGFDHRCEPWQPMKVDGNGDFTAHADPSTAMAWERTDGWRVTLRNGSWRPDGTHCNAEETILKYSPDHFLEFGSDIEFSNANEAMSAVDLGRPWE